MRKLIWVAIILLVSVTGIAVACAAFDAVKATVSNGIIGIGAWITTKFGDLTHLALTSQYATILFWLVMPITGFVIGTILVARIHFSKVKQILTRQKPVTPGFETEFQREPAEPERQAAPPAKVPTEPEKQETP